MRLHSKPFPLKGRGFFDVIVNPMYIKYLFLQDS